VCARIQEEELRELVDLILKANRVFLAGAGRSGLMAQAFGMRLAQMGLPTHIVGDVTTPKIKAGDLLIVSSVSGETPGAVLWAKLASEAGAAVTVATSRRDSPLGALSSHLVQLPLPERDETTLGTTMELVLHLLWDGLCCTLMDRLGTEEEDLLSNHANLE